MHDGDGTVLRGDAAGGLEAEQAAADHGGAGRGLRRRPPADRLAVLGAAERVDARQVDARGSAASAAASRWRAPARGRRASPPSRPTRPSPGRIHCTQRPSRTSTPLSANHSGGRSCRVAGVLARDEDLGQAHPVVRQRGLAADQRDRDVGIALAHGLADGLPGDAPADDDDACGAGSDPWKVMRRWWPRPVSLPFHPCFGTMNGGARGSSWTSAAQLPQPVDARVALATCSTVVSPSAAMARSISPTVTRCRSTPSAPGRRRPAGLGRAAAGLEEVLGHRLSVAQQLGELDAPMSVSPTSTAPARRSPSQHELAVDAAARVGQHELVVTVGRRRAGRRRRRRLPRPSAWWPAWRRGTRRGRRHAVARGHAGLVGQRRPQAVDDAAVLGALADRDHRRRARAHRVVDDDAALAPRGRRRGRVTSPGGSRRRRRRGRRAATCRRRASRRRARSARPSGRAPPGGRGLGARGA